jgi:hypothetical protein
LVNAFSIFTVLCRKNSEFVIDCGEMRNQQGIPKLQKGNKVLFIFWPNYQYNTCIMASLINPFFRYMCCF